MTAEAETSAPRKWRRQLGLSLLLVIAAGLGYGQLLEPGMVPYSPYSDLVAQHLAMKEVLHRNLAGGFGLPFWKSDMMSGGPALTHPQALYTHPLQLPFLFREPAAAAGPSIWLHLVAIAVSFQLLGFVLGLGIWPQAFMAFAGLFASKLILIVYAGWLPVLPGLACAPLLIAALLRSLDRPGGCSALGLTAAAALAFHSGHLQIAYYCLLFLGTYAAIRLVGWLRTGDTTRARRVALTCGGALLLAAGCTAYLLLPLALESHLFSRGDASYGFFLSRGALAPRVLLTFLHPEILGTPIDDSYPEVELWEDEAYFGLVPEALVIVGVLLGWRRRHTPFLAAGFLVSVVLAFDTPLLRLGFEAVPGFALFRHPSRLLFLSTLLGVPLAGVGLQALMERLGGSASGVRRASWLAAFLIAAVAAEGFYYARRYVQLAPAEVVIPQADFRRFLAADTSVYRVAPLQRFALNYGWAASMGLDLVTGFDAYNSRNYRQYLGLLASGELLPPGTAVWLDLDAVARWDLLDALNTRYLISTAPLRPLPDGLRLVAEFRSQPIFVFYRGLGRADLFVYENRNARPRVFWAARLVPAASPDEALRLVARSDLRDVTVVEGVAPEPGSPEARASASLRIESAGDGRLAFATHTAQRRFAVISEVWHPGWRALLDGRPTALYRTDGALMGAWIPAGSHRVELSFRPLRWTAACSISMVSAVLTLGLVAVCAARRFEP